MSPRPHSSPLRRSEVAVAGITASNKADTYTSRFNSSLGRGLFNCLSLVASKAVLLRGTKKTIGTVQVMSAATCYLMTHRGRELLERVQARASAWDQDQQNKRVASKALAASKPKKELSGPLADAHAAQAEKRAKQLAKLDAAAQRMDPPFDTHALYLASRAAKKKALTAERKEKKKLRRAAEEKAKAAKKAAKKAANPA